MSGAAMVGASTRFGPKKTFDPSGKAKKPE